MWGCVSLEKGTGVSGRKGPEISLGFAPQPCLMVLSSLSNLVRFGSLPSLTSQARLDGGFKASEEEHRGRA